MTHVLTLPGQNATAPANPASLARLIDHATVGNISTMDSMLWNVFERRPELEERRLCYLANLSLILDICASSHRRQYMTQVLTAFQERNLCHSEFDVELPATSSAYVCDEDRARLNTLLADRERLERTEHQSDEDEDASDNMLVMRLTQQNNQLKRKNKENRKSLQLRKKHRHDKLIKERMLSGRQDDIFNMFKRICSTQSEPEPAEPPPCFAPCPNSQCIDMKPGVVVLWRGGVWDGMAQGRRGQNVDTRFDESDELFCSMYWSMVRNSEGYVDHICDCITDFENRKVMAEHVEVVCPSCNRRELVHQSKFSSTWSCKHCGFYFSAVTANTDSQDATQDPEAGTILQEMREHHEQDMNRESVLLNDIYTGCDYKTRQEYEYNRNANRLNHEKHRINFQNYLREFLHPNLELVSERHLELVRKEMELDNGRRPYESWEDINMTKLEQTLKRLHMKKYTKNLFTVVTLLAVNPPPLLTNNLFDLFMDIYRKLSVAFLECKSEGWCRRRTMIRNCFVFEELCETYGLVCFRKFYRKVKSATSVEDHRVIYEWCCERAGLPLKNGSRVAAAQ